MNKQYEQVREFHHACGEKMPERPQILDKGPLVTNHWLSGSLWELTQEMKEISKQKFHGEDIGGMVAKRVSWMLEELAEFAAADTLEDQADALIDLIYFAIGTFTMMGVKPEALFDIVHNANMGKVGPDGRVLRNEQGKIVKPDNWEKYFAPEPKIQAEINRQMFETA